MKLSLAEMPYTRMVMPVSGTATPAHPRLPIAAVPAVVEGHREVTVLHERDRKWLHQLLRTGEAVRNDDERARIVGRYSGRAENRDRHRAETSTARADAGDGAIELVECAADQHSRQPRCRDRDRGDAMASFMASGWSIDGSFEATVHLSPSRLPIRDILRGVDFESQ